MVPPNSMMAAVATNRLEMPGPPRASPTSLMLVVVKPVAAIKAKNPNIMGTSPIRVVMNALIAALELACSSYQWPISRYEQTPMISQPTSS